MQLATVPSPAGAHPPPPPPPPPTPDLLKDNFDVTGNNALKVVNKTANGVVSSSVPPAAPAAD